MILTQLSSKFKQDYCGTALSAQADSWASIVVRIGRDGFKLIVDSRVGRATVQDAALVRGPNWPLFIMDLDIANDSSDALVLSMVDDINIAVGVD